MATVATMQARDTRVADPVMSTGLATIERELRAEGSIGMATIEEHPEWPLLARLPMRLSAAIPLPGFRVRNLLGLKLGQVIPSAWPSVGDVPLKVGSVQLSWSEFEVVEQTMAIRLTRLA
jgi:hypothetical protein